MVKLKVLLPGLSSLATVTEEQGVLVDIDEEL